MMWPRRQLGDGRAHFEVTTRSLGKIPEDYDPSYMAFAISSDFSTTARAAWRKGSCFVVAEGFESAAYDGVGKEVRFLRSGAQSAEQHKEGGKPRLAFAACRDGKWFAVVNGVEGPSYDGIEQVSVVSEGPEGVVYAARKGAQWFAVRNGQEIGPYDGVCGFATSGDGRLAYGAMRAGKWFVVNDGVEGPQYVGAYNPVFSPDGKRLAFPALDKDEERKFCVCDGEEGKRYEDVDQITFSPDGRHLAYSATVKKFILLKYVLPSHYRTDQLAVVDGIEGPMYYYVRGPVFSADSKHAGYLGWSNDKQQYSGVVDGRTTGIIENLDAHSVIDDGDPTTLRLLDDGGEEFILHTVRLVPD
jgi:hypothetical protein